MPQERKELQGEKENEKYFNEEKYGESKIKNRITGKQKIAFAPVNHRLEIIFVNIFLFCFVKFKKIIIQKQYIQNIYTYIQK